MINSVKWRLIHTILAILAVGLVYVGAVLLTSGCGVQRPWWLRPASDPKTPYDYCSSVTYTKTEATCTFLDASVRRTP